MGYDIVSPQCTCVRVVVVICLSVDWSVYLSVTNLREKGNQISPLTVQLSMGAPALNKHQSSL